MEHQSDIRFCTTGKFRNLLLILGRGNSRAGTCREFAATPCMYAYDVLWYSNISLPASHLHLKMEYSSVNAELMGMLLLHADEPSKSFTQVCEHIKSKDVYILVHPIIFFSQ